MSEWAEGEQKWNENLFLAHEVGEPENKFELNVIILHESRSPAWMIKLFDK